MLKRLAGLTAAVLLNLMSSATWAQQDIRWGTPPVGTAGHKAMVTLANLLNKEMPKYRISVLPTAGAIATVKGYATKDLDGNYGSDVAFHELATDSGFTNIVISETVEGLREFNLKTIAAGHCTGWRATAALASAFPDAIAPTAVGKQFTF